MKGDKQAQVSKEIFEEQNKKLADLETELANEKQAHLDTLAVNAELQAKIEELEMAPAAGKTKAAQVVKIPDQPFKVDKLAYVFVVPAFYYNGVKVTAEQALQNKALLADLVEQGSGLIKRTGE